MSERLTIWPRDYEYQVGWEVDGDEGLMLGDEAHSKEEIASLRKRPRRRQAGAQEHPGADARVGGARGSGRMEAAQGLESPEAQQRRPRMQMKDDAAQAWWAEQRESIAKIDDQMKREYVGGILDFADAWATEMEARLVEGKTVADVYQDAGHEVDRRPQFGITGNMYGHAVALLARGWKYGEDLRVAHNTEYGHPNAPKGAVVNPAIVTIGVPDESNEKPQS